LKYVIDITKKHVEVMLGCKEEDPTQFRILKCEDSKLQKTNRINHDATYLEADINLIFRQ